MLNLTPSGGLLVKDKRTANGLLLIQIAFSCLLLISAAALDLVINSITRIDYGIDSSNYISGLVNMDTARQYEVGDIEQFQAELRQELLSHPGISGVTFSNSPSMGGPIINYFSLSLLAALLALGGIVFISCFFPTLGILKM